MTNSEYPEYAKVNNKLYKINTDFKIALECDKIVHSDVCEEEKVLAIINEFDRYPAFGEPCKTCKVLFVSP